MKNILKKNISDGFKVLIIAGALFVGVAHGASWTGPTKAFPNGNAIAPVNVTGSSQSKNGPLGVSGMFSGSDSYFGGKVGVGGQVPGSSLSLPSADLQVSGSLIVGGNPGSGCTVSTCQVQISYDNSNTVNGPSIYVESDKVLGINTVSGKDVFFGSNGNESDIDVSGDMTVSPLANPSAGMVCVNPGGQLYLC